MRPERGQIIGIVLVFVFVISGLVIISEDSDGVLAADVEVELSTKEQFARYTGDGFSQVQYQGTLNVRVVSLPNGQVMDLTLHLENEDLDHEFDPWYFMVTKSTVGEEFSFNLSIFVDEMVQAGEINIGVYARYSYRPGMIGGTSNISEALLYVDECREGSLDCPLSVDIVEGNMEILDLEVINCGNTWMEFELSIDGISRAGSRGIEVNIDPLVFMELFYQTSEVLEIQIYVDDIKQDTNLALEFRLNDHATGDEYCRTSVMINALAENDPVVPDPPGNGDGKEVPGDDDDPGINPDDDDKNDAPSDDVTADEGSADSIVEIWMVVPILLIVVGVGAYIIVVVRRT